MGLHTEGRLQLTSQPLVQKGQTEGFYRSVKAGGWGWGICPLVGNPQLLLGGKNHLTFGTLRLHARKPSPGRGSDRRVISGASQGCHAVISLGVPRASPA